jgi:lathosterol oxidase
VIAHLLGLPDTPGVMFLVFVFGGMLYFFLIASIAYFLYFKKFKAKFHPSYALNRREMKSAIKWVVIGIVGNGLLMLPIHMAIAKDYSMMYYDVSEHGWGWMFAQVALLLVFTETLIYWTHWAFHKSPFLWKYVHERHHKYKVPQPYSALSFNPLDSFLQAVPHHIAAFFFPVHAGIYVASVTFVTLWAVCIHDRVSFFRWPWLNYTDHHTLHHWYSDFNLGQYTTFWDRLVGTYRSPTIDYEDVPEGIIYRPPNVRPTSTLPTALQTTHAEAAE